MEDFTIYKKQRNKLTHTKEAAERAYFKNLFRNTSNTSDSWKNTNQLLRKNKPKAAFPQSMKVNGKLVTCPQQICMKLNKHFAEVGEKLSDKLQQTTKKNMHKKFLGTSQISSMVMQPADE